MVIILKKYRGFFRIGIDCCRNNCTYFHGFRSINDDGSGLSNCMEAKSPASIQSLPDHIEQKVVITTATPQPAMEEKHDWRQEMQTRKLRWRMGSNLVTVLVHAVAGGVGSLLCQWASALGATVIGTVSSKAKVNSSS